MEVIKAIKTPDNPKDMRSALGFFNYFRHYIQNFSKIAASLCENVTKLKVKFTQKHDEAFNKLKDDLVRLDLLVMVNYDLKPVRFHMDVDASQHALGAVLKQIHGRKVIGVIEMASGTLTVAERNYPIRQKELLLIVFAVKKFRHYILGYETVVYTDHQSLESLFASNTRPESERTIRWLESLQEVQLKVRYRDGNANVLAHCFIISSFLVVSLYNRFWILETCNKDPCICGQIVVFAYNELPRYMELLRGINHYYVSVSDSRNKLISK